MIKYFLESVMLSCLSQMRVQYVLQTNPLGPYLFCEIDIWYGDMEPILYIQVLHILCNIRPCWFLLVLFLHPFYYNSMPCFSLTCKINWAFFFVVKSQWEHIRSKFCLGEPDFLAILNCYLPTVFKFTRYFHCRFTFIISG